METYDAHPHVRSCPKKESGHNTDTYFGTRAQFEAAQPQKRCQALQTYLETLTLDERVTALASLHQDLADLGIHRCMIGL